MDPVADMLTHIRNTQAVGGKTITLPASRHKIAILTILKEEGYIEGFEVLTANNKKNIAVTLRYYQGKPVIEKISRVSRPGLRVYQKSKAMPVIRAGMGIAIVSTPKGVMTASAARDQNMGGEVLCVVE
jgi:small subunit ribosomal protein S8